LPLPALFLLLILASLSPSEPVGLLVQEPEVTSPEEEVEKAQENRHISSTKVPPVCSHTLPYLGVAVCGWVMLSPVADGSKLVVAAPDPVVRVGHQLQTSQAIGPGSRPSQPEHGQQGGHQEVYLGVLLLLVHVEGGEEHIHTNTEQDNSNKPKITQDIPDKAVEPADDTSEHKKLSIRSKVARKCNILIFHIFTKGDTTWRRVSKLVGRVLVQPGTTKQDYRVKEE
jgi:hypothetical protein